MAATSYLLDTQVALWIMTGSSRIDAEQFNARFKPSSSEFIFHQVSTWEIQIKFSLGKLLLPSHPEKLLPSFIEASGFKYSKIEDKGIFFLNKLPNLHKDPFDRLLIAHAAINGWTAITSDEAFQNYPIMVEMV